LCQYDELEINNRYRLKNSKSLASVEKIASVFASILKFKVLQNKNAAAKMVWNPLRRKIIFGCQILK